MIKMGNSDNICSMVDLYALNALDQHELDSYIPHLNKCSICQKRIRELNEIVIYLDLYNMQETVPPKGMEQRIFSKLLSNKQPFFKKWKRQIIVSAAILSCIIAVCVGMNFYKTEVPEIVKNIDNIPNKNRDTPNKKDDQNINKKNDQKEKQKHVFDDNVLDNETSNKRGSDLNINNQTQERQNNSTEKRKPKQEKKNTHKPSNPSNDHQNKSPVVPPDKPNDDEQNNEEPPDNEPVDKEPPNDQPNEPPSDDDRGIVIANIDAGVDVDIDSDINVNADLDVNAGINTGIIDENISLIMVSESDILLSNNQQSLLQKFVSSHFINNLINVVEKQEKRAQKQSKSAQKREKT